jgi:hypothetical protein
MTDTNKASNPKHNTATPGPVEKRSLDGVTSFHRVNRPAESGGQTQGGGESGQTAQGDGSGSGSGSNQPASSGESEK